MVWKELVTGSSDSRLISPKISPLSISARCRPSSAMTATLPDRMIKRCVPTSPFLRNTLSTGMVFNSNNEVRSLKASSSSDSKTSSWRNTPKNLSRWRLRRRSVVSASIFICNVAKSLSFLYSKRIRPEQPPQSNFDFCIPSNFENLLKLSWEVEIFDIFSAKNIQNGFNDGTVILEFSIFSTSPTS